MKVLKGQRALIPFVILLGLVSAGAAFADPTSFKVPLTGAQGVPPVETSGSGTAELTYDPATRVVTWNITYTGLSSPSTMAHFHGPAAEGKNAPPVIWLSKQGSPPANPMTGTATLTPDQAKQFSAGEPGGLSRPRSRATAHPLAPRCQPAARGRLRAEALFR
jgi:hypothetical protein